VATVVDPDSALDPAGEADDKETHPNPLDEEGHQEKENEQDRHAVVKLGDNHSPAFLMAEHALHYNWAAGKIVGLVEVHELLGLQFRVPTLDDHYVWLDEALLRRKGVVVRRQRGGVRVRCRRLRREGVMHGHERLGRKGVVHGRLGRKRIVAWEVRGVLVLNLSGGGTLTTVGIHGRVLTKLRVSVWVMRVIVSTQLSRD
jgi:hypothetical protein